MFWKKNKPNKLEEERIRLLTALKSHTIIMIQHKEASYGTTLCEILSNNPGMKKMYVRINWSNVGKREYILDYSGYELENFTLFNKTIDWIMTDKDDQEISSTNIAELQKQMEKAINAEQYEIAEKIQKQIDKLAKK